MFCVSAIPKDTQLRDVLDEVTSDKLEEVISDYFYQLQRGKALEGYQILPGKYLITLDAPEYKQVIPLAPEHILKTEIINKIVK